jgi:heat shock protein HslJ
MPLFAALLTVVAPTACSQNNAALGADITGVTWTLIEVNGTPVDAASVNRPATLLLDDQGRASGVSGCNQFGGSYTLEGEDLHFGGIAMTRMACPGRMDVETAYAAALEATRGWRVTDGMLELLADDVVLARLRR